MNVETMSKFAPTSQKEITAYYLVEALKSLEKAQIRIKELEAELEAKKILESRSK